MQRSLCALRLLTFPLCAASSLLAGCATNPSPTPAPVAASAPDTAPSHEANGLPPGYVPVMRQGRYTLAELVPSPEQRDLMRQIVDVSIPPAFDATVGDAIRYVLQRSGYRLCDSANANALYTLPLPAAHLRLGPMTLLDALQTLAGADAWKLSVDEAARTVCFERTLASLPSREEAPSQILPVKVQP